MRQINHYFDELFAKINLSSTVKCFWWHVFSQSHGTNSDVYQYITSLITRTASENCIINSNGCADKSVFMLWNVWNIIGLVAIEKHFKNVKEIHSDITDFTVLFPCICILSLVSELSCPIRTGPQQIGWRFRLPTNEKRTRWPSR